MLNYFGMNNMSTTETKQLNPLQLALVGDAIYEVFVRTTILNNNRELSAHKIHVKAISYVKAKSQSKVIHNIIDELTEEEYYIYKRGRNTKSATVPKNADVREYRDATGFESLVGFLYLTGNSERLKFIFDKSIEIINS